MISLHHFPPLRLDIAGLGCRRGERILVRDLDFSLKSGEIGLLRGPNGAGKTTLLLTIAGTVAATNGTIALEGGPEDFSANLHLSGYQAAIKPRLSVAENLNFWATVNGGPGIKVDQALATVGLAAIADLDAGHLSSGQMRRLALARLLVSARPLWLLDEPTAALDAAGELLVAKLIDAHLDAGGLVVAATHHDLALRDMTRVKTVQLGRQT